MGKPTLFQLPEEYDCSGNQGRNCIAMANLLNFFIPAQICACIIDRYSAVFQSHDRLLRTALTPRREMHPRKPSGGLIRTHEILRLQALDN